MRNRICTAASELEVVQGSLSDYKQLCRFHYRSAECGPVHAVYKLQQSNRKRRLFGDIAGVIVYTRPVMALAMRNIATEGVFRGFGDRAFAMRMVNANVRCIGRVIIDPRYSAAGLAVRLVKETLSKVDYPFIEAMAAMGRVNPFFEKAGMEKYEPKMPLRTAKLIEALSVVGVEESEFINPEKVHSELAKMEPAKKNFIQRLMRDFLAGYGRRYKRAADSLERTRYVLGKLSSRPVYYIWRNPKRELITDF